MIIRNIFKAFNFRPRRFLFYSFSAVAITKGVMVYTQRIEERPDISNFLQEMHHVYKESYIDDHSMHKFVSQQNDEHGEMEQFKFDNNSYHKTFVPICVFYPTTTEDVVQFAKLCTKYKIEMASYNKGTSLEGGVLPTSERCAIISFQYMNKILEFNPQDRQMVVEPGIGWMDLNTFLEPHGFFFPVDPGPGAGIGGMIGTCCSGTNAMKYGTMRNWIYELEVVLADGRVIHTGNKAKKSSAGYNLTQLLCGSEGTLGFITKATISLAHLPKHSQVITACFSNLESLSAAVEGILKHDLPIRCCELMDKNMVNVILQRQPYGQLIENSNLLMLALNSEEDQIQSQLQKITTILEQFEGHNVSLAIKKQESERLWSIRKQALWLVAQHGKEKKGSHVKVWTTDVCVPISKLSSSIQQTQIEIDQAGLIGPIIGHVGDGNYHVTFVVDYNNKEEWRKIQQINHNMILRAIQCGGTCTGEHGVGIGKRQYLEIERGSDQVELMRQIKRVFDPYYLLNPGKVFYTTSTQSDHLDQH